MGARVKALKTEIVEAVRRKMEQDNYAGAHVVALQAMAMCLCDLISACAQDEQHRQNLVTIASLMLSACTKPEENAFRR